MLGELLRRLAGHDVELLSANARLHRELCGSEKRNYELTCEVEKLRNANRVLSNRNAELREVK